MLRIPNPGSDIPTFIRIFHGLFEALKSRTAFTLDDITTTLIERNLATSSGFMGEAALQRSTREDRSRDPLYNQSKMYTELFKVLGLIHPTHGSKLTFNFTLLGAHFAEAKRDEISLFKECILGIVYPTRVLAVKGSHILRPFSAILKTMDALDGMICREEMIIGPLSLANDRDPQEFDSMIEKIRSIRGDVKKLVAGLAQISTSRNISSQTMKNYTRFPNSVLRWTEWADVIPQRIYGYRSPFNVLTDEGRQVLKFINSAMDVRETDIAIHPEESQLKIIEAAFYQMLQRAGFDVTEALAGLTGLPEYYTGKTLLFSPFQELDPEFMKLIFPVVAGTETARDVHTISLFEEISHPVITSKVSTYIRKDQNIARPEDDVYNLFKTKLDAGLTLDQTIDLIFEEAKGFNRADFYPLIAQLFTSIGYRCSDSRAGVNYQRWDAMIEDEVHSIPIEIKSPGEEEFISVKGVRQALENKVILLSRKPYPTKKETTSLVVGYNLPNNRSEVTGLVEDIKSAFGISIGVIDLKSLLRLVGHELFQNKGHDMEQFQNLEGIIDVSVV